ncbi:class I SAM-dependent methyltransferase [Aestuariivirga litoralis]|uniref:class I SAM-dependent methyltransferase n=1 Tax=Aestuariivirga litoralis TaxID=2650924 RepID=UPI0018C64AC2|nr:class I SAM-dependent methyltransferase [Aestuariivirga litoralis]MBG1231693.1 SAM-dependent methyltransferase [Aestuariivirga litoralis]
MATETLNLTPEVFAYYRGVAYREPAVLAELREETSKLSNSGMQIAAEQGAFMAMLASLVAPKHVLEIGTFTGYSSLAMALACNAKFVCADVSEDYTSVAKRYWAKAGVAARMDLRLTGGTAVINELLAAGKADTFDLMFIDADKSSYDSYYEGGLKLLRAGGLMMIDNVLWGGDVADPIKKDADTNALRSLNAKIQADERVQLSMVPIGDGVTLARKH